jgi:hypothetical protein
MARTTRLLDISEEAIKLLIGYIRQGAYPYVAAKAVGIPSSTWFRWMDWGKKGGKERVIYRELWEKVEQAHAEARVLAEATVRKDNPFNWLRYGPGRERPGEPGWTESHEISGPDKGPVQVAQGLTPELAAVIKEAERLILAQSRNTGGDAVEDALNGNPGTGAVGA